MADNHSSQISEGKWSYLKQRTYICIVSNAIYPNIFKHIKSKARLTWKFRNHILLSRMVNVNTWSTNGWLLGWYRGVLKILQETSLLVSIPTHYELSCLSQQASPEEDIHLLYIPTNTFQESYVPELRVLLTKHNVEIHQKPTNKNINTLFEIKSTFFKDLFLNNN